MAKKKQTPAIVKFVVCFFALLLGAFVGFGGFVYKFLPEHDELVIKDSDVYYSFDDKTETTSNKDFVSSDTEVSIHFLELGNKYTGDCTYIKAGDVDILIDCGSKSSSVSTVSEYINQFVTDGILEYVIITHAHQDHYAGFATASNIQSIFDLYECKTIIDFAQTNQKSKRLGTSANKTMYDYYLDNLDKEIENGAVHYKASDLSWNEEDTTKPFHKFFLNEDKSLSLEILNSYYYYNKATTENDYSVCTMLNQGSKKFLFTGDLENTNNSNKGEKLLVDYYRDQYGYSSTDSIDIEVYKAGHHGSKTSSSMDLLNFFKPKIVCICCCAGSSEYTSNLNNQFPTQTFIDNVSQFTDAVYVTTLCVDYKKNLFTSFNGNIVIISNKNNTLQVKCTNNDLKLKDSEWFKNNRICANW